MGSGGIVRDQEEMKSYSTEPDGHGEIEENFGVLIWFIKLQNTKITMSYTTLK